MTQSNDILRTLLSNFPAGELPPGEPQTIFEAIRSRLNDAPDSMEELRNLYKVKGFSDFAVGLMWMVDRAIKHPGQVSIGPEDETLLLSSFRRAVGSRSASSDGPGEAPAPAEVGVGEMNPQTFAGQLEQFSDAVQGGSGGVRMLLEDLVAECDTVSNGANSDDVKELANLLKEFLKYLSDAELFDDVRVINLLSNISSTVSQWANAAPGEQPGLLAEAHALLRDFKSHFE
ncbi:MAG TPA: hypothetical protein VMH23_00780 [Bacteroidota bacterium]|nr:hypothetical protein [Bacteroidota bacterium]